MNNCSEAYLNRENKINDYFQDSKENIEFYTEKLLGISSLNNKLNIKFINDKNVIVYLSGNFLIFYDLLTEETNHVSLNNKFQINSIFVFEFAINNIVLEEVDTLTKTKKINFIRIEQAEACNNYIDLNYASNSRLIDLKISYDNSKLTLLIKDTDFMIISVWCLHKYKLLGELNLSDKLNQISFYTNDCHKILLIGDSIIKSIKLNNNSLILDWSFDLTSNYVSHSWINETFVLLGNEHGEIVLFNTGHKNIEKVFSLSCELIKVMQNSLKQDVNLFNLNVNQIVKTRKGFICLIDNRNIVAFSMNKFNELKIIGFGVLKNTFISVNMENLNKISPEEISNVSLNKNENILLIYTNKNSLYKIDLNDVNYCNDENFSIKSLELKIIKNFHHKKIISYDYSIKKAFMVTCDAENTIKLWNYCTGELELSKTFNENVISVSLSNNNNNLSLAIAFTNKIIFYLIVRNRLRHLKTLNLSQCIYCKFSNETDLLGAISLSSLYIYELCEQKLELSLKSGMIQHFAWINQDRHVISCSNTGIICAWNVSTGQLVFNYLEKRVYFSHISFSINDNLNGFRIFALDRLNNIHVISSTKLNELNDDAYDVDYLKLEKLIESNKLIKSKLTCFVAYRNFILLGCIKGHVYLYNYDLDKLLITTKTSNTNHNHIFNNNSCYLLKHNSRLCQLFLISNLNMNYLVSCSSEGLIVLSSLMNMNMSSNYACIVEKTKFFKEEEEKYLQEMNLKGCIGDILINNYEIKNKIEYVFSLKQILNELNQEKFYQIKLSDIERKEKLRNLNKKVENNLNSLNVLLNEIEFFNERDYNEWKSKLDKLVFKFKNDLQCVREDAEIVLCNEYKISKTLYEKYDNLCYRNKECLCLNEIQESFENENKNQSTQLKFYQDYKINELEQDAKLKLNSLFRISKILENEINEAELSGDKLMEEIKLKDKEKLKNKRALNEKQKYEIGLNKNKLVSLKDKLELLKEKSKNFNENYLIERKRFLNKQEQVLNLKKVLKIKSNEINKNEKLISDLNKRKERLNKTSFIQDSKLNELKAGISNLNKLNEQLKLNMQLNEEKLGVIISSKLKLINRYKLKS